MLCTHTMHECPETDRHCSTTDNQPKIDSPPHSCSIHVLPSNSIASGEIYEGIKENANISNPEIAERNGVSIDITPENNIKESISEKASPEFNPKMNTTSKKFYIIPEEEMRSRQLKQTSTTLWA